MESPIATTWLAAVESGFARPTDWRGWADKMILSASPAPLWIINMSLAENLVQLRAALMERLDLEWHPKVDAVKDNEVLGYLWIRFERGEISLRDCLDLAGRYADSSEASVSCETIYSLLNRLEGGERSVQVEEAARAIFGPLASLARYQWKEVQDMSAYKA